MQFIDAVNRLLRKQGVIRGDTDPITSFGNLQHGTTTNSAMISIQDALNDLVMAKVLPPTRIASASITLQQTVRTYALASDFQRFWDDAPFFYDRVANINIYEYSGGEQQLRIDVQDYRVPGAQPGYPNWFYNVDAAVPTVGFFQTPDGGVHGRSLTYDYQKQIVPVAAADLLPFQSDAQAFAFIEMAAIRYSASMPDGDKGVDIRRLPAYVSAMAKTIELVNPNKLARKYGHIYI